MKKRKADGSNWMADFRPSTFDEVVGHASIIRSLKSVLKDGKAKSFLFVGPSGVGKTTLARIVGREVGAGMNVTEIDAATYTGIDDMRAVIDMSRTRALGDTGVRLVIIDEAHALSSAAWKSLLKALEEPAPHLYWALCTTDAGKVPTVIKTRCATYVLKPLSVSELYEFLSSLGICSNDAVVELCAKTADGSPRQALANLAVCADCASVAEARELLMHADSDDDAVGTVCRLIVAGSLRWKDVQEFFSASQGRDPESLRRAICNYVSKAALGSAFDSARALADVLEFFAEPCVQGDKTKLVVSFARLVGELEG